MKELTVVIPVHNHWELTKECIASILYSNYPQDDLEIIVVDDASTDETRAFLDFQKCLGYPIKVLTNKENSSYLLSANRGWKEVQTPYCLHLNNDVILQENCIACMMDGFDYNPKIGIMGGIQHCSGEPQNMWRENKTLFRRGDSIDNYHDLRYVVPMVESELVQPAINVEAAGFQCALVKRGVWEKIGYFDETFAPCMGEQEDYSIRTLMAGFEIGIAPNARFLHKVAATTSDNRPFYQEVVRKNEKLFKQKWGDILRKNLI